MFLIISRPSGQHWDASEPRGERPARTKSPPHSVMSISREGPWGARKVPGIMIAESRVQSWKPLRLLWAVTIQKHWQPVRVLKGTRKEQKAGDAPGPGDDLPRSFLFISWRKNSTMFSHHPKKGLELYMAAVNRRWEKKAELSEFSCSVAPNLLAFGVSHVIHLYLFFPLRPNPNFKEAEKSSNCGKIQGKTAAEGHMWPF